MTLREAKIKDAECSILVLMHWHFVNDSKIYFKTKEIFDYIGDLFPVNSVRMAISNLISQTLIDCESGITYSINNEGISHVEFFYKNKYDNIINSIGITTDAEVNGSNLEEYIETDEWSPLPLDRESDSFISAVKATETAISAIEGDNGFAVSEPDNREQILWSLRQGIILLKDRLPSRSQIKSILVEPLKYVIKLFGKNAISKICTVAVEKLASLLF